MNAYRDISNPENHLKEGIRVNNGMGIITDWNIIKHLAQALSSSAIDFSFNYIIEEMLLVSMAAKARRTRTNSLTILAINISPNRIQSVFPCIFYTMLEFFKLLFAHWLTIVCVSNYTIYVCNQKAQDTSHSQDKLEHAWLHRFR